MSSTIDFEAEVITINGWNLIKVPTAASSKLPSRGQVMVKGTINGVDLLTALEPDGAGSHWFAIDKELQSAANLAVGKKAVLAIQATKDWPEPTIPKDLQAAIDANADIQLLWKDVTPMARWEWIRWISSTNQAETRARRVEVSLSKLRNGLRRPCCFNRSMCCVPEVSKSGVLIGA